MAVVLVQAENFFFFCDTELKGGPPPPQVSDHQQDEVATEERVGSASSGTCQLISKLDPVVLNPASSDVGDAVQMSDRIPCTMSVVVLLPPIGTHIAKKAVKRLPTKPPTACTAKMSSGSSHLNAILSIVARLHVIPPTTPKMTAAQGDT